VIKIIIKIEYADGTLFIIFTQIYIIAMKLYIQYDRHLICIDIEPCISIGSLYEKILETIGITHMQVIGMICKDSYLGTSKYDFNSPVQFNIQDNEFIIVVLNHYPDITSKIASHTQTLFLNWLNRENMRQTAHLNQYRYDPIFAHPPSHPALSSSSSSHPPSHPSSHPPSHPSSSHQPAPSSHPPLSSSSSRQPAPSSHSPLSFSRFLPISIEFTTLNSADADMDTPIYGHFTQRASSQIADDMRFSTLLWNAISDTFTQNLMNNDELESVPITISDSDFDGLKREKYCDIVNNYKSKHRGEAPYDKCPISQENMENDQSVVVLGCGHYFSEDGLKQWLTRHSSKCPCCKMDVRDMISESGETNNNRTERHENMGDEDEDEDEDEDGDEY
jgi:hypothetical protein